MRYKDVDIVKRRGRLPAASDQHLGLSIETDFSPRNLKIEIIDQPGGDGVGVVSVRDWNTFQVPLN